jgi:hypothetical protein
MNRIVPPPFGIGLGAGSHTVSTEREPRFHITVAAIGLVVVLPVALLTVVMFVRFYL